MQPTPFDLLRTPLPRGTVLLEASAGTGKTYTLVGIVLRLLLEDAIQSLDQALLVTFTVAATEELKGRVRSGLQRALRAIGIGDDDPFFAALAHRPGARAKLQAALQAFDTASIHTIHGFCQRVLQESAFESQQPFQTEFAADPLPLLYEAAADALRGLYDREASLRSAIIAAEGFHPAGLVEAYRLWQRYPDVALAPPDPDPEHGLPALTAAVAAAMAAFDDDARERIERMEWLAKAPFADAATRAGFRMRWPEQPTAVLGLLCGLGHSRIEAWLYKGSRRHAEHPFFHACDAIAAHCEALHAHLRAWLLLRMHERLVAQKAAAGVLSFDDLLQRTEQALQPSRRGAAVLATLQQRYKVALVDEFQDTDSRQWSIFATCFADRPLFLIGDPKQSIYGFRGANLRTYKAAAKAAAQHFTLARNFRSSAELVRAVQTVFGRVHPFADPDIALPAVTAVAVPGQKRIVDRLGAAFCWRLLPIAPNTKGDKVDWIDRDDAERAIGDDVANEIVNLLRTATIDGRPVRPADIAILTRTNMQGTLMQERLRTAGVPATLGKAGDIFATEELVELRQLLTAVLRPNDAGSARAARSTRLWGESASSLAATGDDDERLDAAIQHLDQWRRLWQRHGVVVMFEQVLVDLAVHRRWLGAAGGERRLTNLRQLVELLHEAEHSHRLAPESLLDWLQREEAHQEDLDYTVRELRLDTDEDAVTIMTVHGSKGLEFEIVFCPFAWHGMGLRATEVVSDERGHRLAFGVSKNGEGSADYGPVTAQNLAEDLRLTYVALTRASRRCYVHLAPTRSASHSGLAWLVSKRPRPAGIDGNGERKDDWAVDWTNRVPGEALAWPQVLADQVAANPGAMRVDEIPLHGAALAPAPPQAAISRPPAALRAREPKVQKRARGLHSFSSLVANAPPIDADRDILDPPATDLDAGAPAVGHGIFGFARGPAAGQCLHDILEHTDFAAIDAPATGELVRRTLAAHGLLAAGSHPGELDPPATVLQLLRDTAAARLPTGERLGAICQRAQAEWQFLLPTANADTEVLAAIFSDGGDATAMAQAERLRGLRPAQLAGFLVGFVDLIGEADGRYWVLDWKSNHLGDRAADYQGQALAAAMVEHDYLLQYHLYLLALHRHLRVRRPDYDYDRHIGGACYVFLRAVAAGSDAGLFIDRVPRARIERLDAWVDGRRWR
jgi:exodeoxyribonuclease V beta subunit